MFVHLSIQLPINSCISHLSAYPLMHPLTHPFIHHLSVCLLIPLSIHLPIYLVHHPSICPLIYVLTSPSTPQLTHSPIHLLIHSPDVLTVKSPMISTVLGAHIFNSICGRNKNRCGPYPRALASHLFPLSLQNRVLGIACHLTFGNSRSKLSHTFPTIKFHKLYPASSS